MCFVANPGPSEGDPTGLDRSFGFGGALQFEQPLRMLDATADSSGEVLVLGDYELAENDIRLVIGKVGTNGSMDPTFGCGAWTEVIMPGRPHTSVPSAIGLQSSGKIVIASDVATVGAPIWIAVIRLDLDGWPDPTFAGRGWAAIDEDSPNAVSGLAISDDRIAILVDHFEDARADVYRLTEDGLLDETFAEGGHTTLGTASHPLAADAEGRLLLTLGPGDLPADAPPHLRIARLDTTGRLDESFGRHGVAEIPALTPEAWIPRILPLPDRILLTAWTFSGVSKRFVVETLENGMIDTDLGAGTGVSQVPDGMPSIVTGLSRGEIMLGGDHFTSLLGIGALHADGAVDDSFGSNGAELFRSDLRALTLSKMIGPASSPFLAATYDRCVSSDCDHAGTVSVLLKYSAR